MKSNYWSAFKWISWFIFAFVASQFVISWMIVEVFGYIKNSGFDTSALNLNVLQLVFSALIFVLMFGIFVGIPKRYKKGSLDFEIGLKRFGSLSWWLAIPVIYFVTLMIAGAVSLLISNFIPGYNPSQEQQVGYGGVSHWYEYLAAFLGLVIIPPIIEEVLVRGYLLGKFRKLMKTWMAVILSAVIFGGLHLGLGFTEDLQWNVAIVTTILGISLAILRVKSGSLWPSIALHMVQNGIAFYVLFIAKLPM